VDDAQQDRAVGALLGLAVGDALGVPYEYGTPPDGEPQMVGGGLGGFAPGQWSDDTAMAVCIAQVTATGADLTTEAGLDAVAAQFLAWYADDPPDIGIQTRAVLGAVSSGAGAAQLRAVSEALHRQTGRTAGNGSLMRTSPVALAHLGDPSAISDAARKVSELTHFDPRAGEACVLWCLAIDHAVRTGTADVRVGLDVVDRGYWEPLGAEAEQVEPSHYAGANGWSVAALQGAWSAISRTAGLHEGLVAAVRGGGDTDTVAAIAGQLLGAAHGASALAEEHLAPLHGWPGLKADDLRRLALSTVGA
jgi:ADP-ribosylglycohydrolase